MNSEQIKVEEVVTCQVQCKDMEAFGMLVEGPDLDNPGKTFPIPFLRLDGRWFIETESGKYIPLDVGTDDLETAFNNWQKKFGKEA